MLNVDKEEENKMAFFDKLNNLAKNVGDKANDAIEMTKLNSKINSEKSAITEDYKKIGEFYYEKYSNEHAFDTEVADFLSSIDAHKAAISEVEAQLKSLKEETAQQAVQSSAGSVVCPSCGKANAVGIKFCSECGTKLEEQLPPQSKFCPSCGTSVVEGVKFCPSCGTKID